MLYDYDQKIKAQTGANLLVGIDEAGRGPLAGPVVVGAVVLDLDRPIEGVRDSKKLSEARREIVAKRIEKEAILSVVVIVNEDLIEHANILRATLYGMYQAVEHWKDRSDALFLIDGNQAIPNIAAAKQRTIVKGDNTSASIAAASILAKTKRDRIMRDSARLYPFYEFEKHKGYPTKRHVDLIRQWGLCDIHRKSFCKTALKKQPAFETIF